MRNSIFYSALTDENGNILVDENGNKLLAEIGITDTEVFQNLTQAYMPKNEKIIKDIIIQIDDDITVEQLSEGEKKLILVKTVLEILSDEKTLVLMDEPDAHLHEGRKPALCNMMREYPNRQIVIATHSPIMAQIANEKELLMLELENGKSTILTDEKIENSSINRGINNAPAFRLQFSKIEKQVRVCEFSNRTLLLLLHLPLKIVQRLDMPEAFAGDGTEGQRTEKVD